MKANNTINNLVYNEYDKLLFTDVKMTIRYTAQ